MRTRKSKVKSCVEIARLLDAEGFSDHVASLVTKHALVTATPQQRRRFMRNKRMFSKMVQENLTDENRMVLGKFMSAKLHMAFETGLRIGLTAYLNLPIEQREDFSRAVMIESIENDSD